MKQLKLSVPKDVFKDILGGTKTIRKDFNGFLGQLICAEQPRDGLPVEGKCSFLNRHIKDFDCVLISNAFKSSSSSVLFDLEDLYFEVANDKIVIVVELGDKI